MKILKVYDKINRNVFLSDTTSGNVRLTEYTGPDDYFSIYINTRIFSGKRNNMAYFSCVNVIDDVIRESVDVTEKFILHKKMNENGLLLHSERTHLKDNKCVVTIDRIYDENGEYIELENHRGKRMTKFKIKNEIINLLKTIDNG
jgi:hypothetical protein